MQNFMVMFTFFVFDRKYHFRQIWSEKSKLLVKLKFGTRTIWICRSQSWCSLFLFKTRKTPFGANLVKKYQNCKFKLKFSTKTNLNLWNSTMMFTFSVFDHKHPFWVNLVHKFKIVCSKWNLIQRLFEFAKFNVGVYFICFRLTIVSLSWKLVLILIRIWRIQWWYSLFSVFDRKYPVFGNFYKIKIVEDEI